LGLIGIAVTAYRYHADQQRHAPRHLANNQIARMRERLSAFSGQHFGMITYWNVKEPGDFTKELGNDVLIAAGCQFIKADAFEALVGVVTGIDVQQSDDASEPAKKAADELVAALKEEGVPATFTSEPVYKSPIKIQVGKKP
jgi:hypothetical protein